MHIQYIYSLLPLPLVAFAFDLDSYTQQMECNQLVFWYEYHAETVFRFKQANDALINQIFVAHLRLQLCYWKCIVLFSFCIQTEFLRFRCITRTVITVITT